MRRNGSEEEGRGGGGDMGRKEGGYQGSGNAHLTYLMHKSMDLFSATLIWYNIYEQ